MKALMILVILVCLASIICFVGSALAIIWIDNNDVYYKTFATSAIFTAITLILINAINYEFVD